MTQEIEQRALALVNEARSFKVVDAATCIEADTWWQRLDKAEKEAHEVFDPTVKATDQAHKEAVALRAKVIGPIVEVKTLLKRIAGQWREEQEQLRLAEEARLREAARKLEEDNVLAEAVELEQSGQKEEAEALIQEPLPQPVVIVQKNTPVVKGGPVYREYWDARVIDMMALVKAVAAGQVSINALTPNATFLRQQAQSLRSTMKIPGVEAWSRKV